VTLVDLDETVVRQQLAVERPPLFSQASTGTGTRNDVIGIGDQLEITLIESPPATLFGSGGADPRAPLVAGTMNVPAQVVDGEGYVAVPFVGRVMASGQTPAKLSIEIVRRLRGKANQPDVLVRMLRSESSLVTVVGEVNQSTRMPLNSGRERLLDAIAAAGGSRQPIHKTTLQLTRAEGFLSLPLDRVIQDPRENVLLKAGDVVSLLYQPMAMTVFGATGRQDEVSFESQGITLAQALARAGGLVDHRSAAQGLFLFRLEPAGVQPWTKDAPSVTPDGRVPVVYRLDLRDPRSFFVMQSFKVRNADLLYVANAPAAELQKFLNLVFSAVFPVANLINATN
jgi:polysaccharide export outer membrane protein